MKKLIYILLCLSALVSCEGIESGSDGVFDNPLDSCLLPASVCAGDEGIVQWNGFKGDVSLVLKGDEDFPLDVLCVTESGLVFAVPYNVPSGDYLVVQTHPDYVELGLMEVKEPRIPVTGVKVPLSATPGEVVSITGLGFEKGCKITFISETGNETEIDPVVTYNGVDVLLPESMLEGRYSIYLKQNGLSWLLSSSFEVYLSIVEKSFRRLRHVSPYVGTARLMLLWDMSEKESLSVYEYVVDGEDETLSSYDTYSLTDSGDILSHDGFESSNNLEISYTVDEDGYVTGSDVLRYGDDKTTFFKWNYNSDGYLTSIDSPKLTFRSLAYDNGNLVSFNQIVFEYADPSLTNHPSAPEVTWAYMSVTDLTEPFIYIPYLSGWTMKRSSLLPTCMLLPDPSGSGQVRCELSYEFDEEGYVTSMKWMEGSSAHELQFEYE